MAKDETMVETTDEKSVETESSETNDIVSRHHKKTKVKLSVDEVVSWFDHPEMQVDREKFLRRELKNQQPQAIIEKAIKEDPKKAGVDIKSLNKIANAVIKFEWKNAKGLKCKEDEDEVSFNIEAQCRALLIVMQKLMYLYGVPQIHFEEGEDVFDSEEYNILIGGMEAMLGVKKIQALLHKVTPLISLLLQIKTGLILSTKITEAIDGKAVEGEGENEEKEKTAKGSKKETEGQKTAKKVLSNSTVQNKIGNAADAVVALGELIINNASNYLTYQISCRRLKHHIIKTFYNNQICEIAEEDDEDIVIEVDNEEVIIQNAEGEIVQEVAAEEVEENAVPVTDNDEE